MPSGHPFTDVQSNYYWSSTPTLSVYAWGIDVDHGYAANSLKSTSFNVWPVRGNVVCNNLTISQTGKSFNYKSSRGSLSVTASPALCTWAAASDSTGWLNITSNSSGTGKGTVKYSVSANTSASTRTCHITAGDQTFTVTQAGGTPKISAPSSLKMRNVKKDVTSDTKTITIKNIGTANLEISDVTITGANSAEFIPTNNCTQALAKNETCKVTITFTPSTKGKRSATLNIGSNDPKKATATVKLSGMGKSRR